MSLPNADPNSTTVEVPLTILKKIEYAYDEIGQRCQCCHAQYIHGHTISCELGKVISSVTSDVKIQPE